MEKIKATIQRWRQWIRDNDYEILIILTVINVMIFVITLLRLMLRQG